MAKLFAVLISSLRLFQSRLPLNFNEFVLNLCDLAGGSLQGILILESCSTTFSVKRSHIYGGFQWLSILYTSTISFCRFFCELSKFHPFARVHQASLHYHYYKLFSLQAWSFYLLNCLLLYYKNNHIREQYCKFELTTVFSSNLAFFSLMQPRSLERALVF